MSTQQKPAKDTKTILWRDAANELPDDELTVLVALEDGEVWTGFHDAGQWRYVSADLIGSRVTHWAEFPEPPNDLHELPHPGERRDEH